VETEALRSYLSGKLPPHMVPSGFVVLDSLPLMANGKVDRLALTRLEPGPAGLPARAFVAPRNAVEEKLAEIWRGVLGVDQVGVEDDFFELGGHSLLAVQVISRVREAFGSVLPVRVVFESPTVARLADAIDSLRWAGQPRLPSAANVDYEEFEI
ncbi:MAG TPA: phosphopantetheine-binding protein, partial [Thermoanaerobaculia bacterium]|nr:phosphopantetheine-binding protein [Thermoanaerobaculia bacterium]